MFSAPATSIVNQLFAAVEKIPLLCFFQPFSQLGHSYFQISLHSFCCASGTRFAGGFIGDSSVASASSNVFAPQQYFFSPCLRLLLEVDRRLSPGVQLLAWDFCTSS